MPSKRSNTATRFCKVCFRKIEKSSLYETIFTANLICLRCFREMSPIFETWRIGNVSCMAIYRYSETFRSMLYRYKGCGDIELSDCFLERVRLLIRLRYWGYVIVFAPSYLTHIQKRGFDHVPTMLAKLGNPILDIFEKTDDVKQSSQSKNRRKKIGKYLAIKGNPVLKGKKVLFVDDVYTTGSTTKACLRLMRKLRPRKVSVLVLSKVASHGT